MVQLHWFDKRRARLKVLLGEPYHREEVRGMDTLAIAAVAVILASIVISAWKKYSFCALTVAACIVVYAMEAAEGSWGVFAFTRGRLTDPSMVYTVLTSMYAHASLDHLFFNMIGLAFIGIVLEQRIGTRPFILLYLISGLIGTLVFAGSYWNEPYVAVIGASGAVSGVLGGLARLYPHDQMAFLFFPMYPIKIWKIVVIFIGLQFIFLWAGNIAWQAHLGGLAAGILVAPYVARFRVEIRLRKTVPIAALRKLARTPELRSMLARIEQETVPDVRNAWTEHFMAKARCPICGAPIRVSGDLVRCNRGHLL
jgi:membrane associated rhomboid family serine protease